MCEIVREDVGLNEKQLRTDRKIVQTAIKYRRQPTRKIQTLLEADGIKICSRTIRRRLAEKGYKTYRAVEKPKLTGTMMQKRFKWAKAHSSWTTDQWRKV